MKVFILILLTLVALIANQRLYQSCGGQQRCDSGLTCFRGKCKIPKGFACNPQLVNSCADGNCDKSGRCVDLTESGELNSVCDPLKINSCRPGLVCVPGAFRSSSKCKVISGHRCSQDMDCAKFTKCIRNSCSVYQLSFLEENDSGISQENRGFLKEDDSETEFHDTKLTLGRDQGLINTQYDETEQRDFSLGDDFHKHEREYHHKSKETLEKEMAFSLETLEYYHPNDSDEIKIDDESLPDFNREASEINHYHRDRLESDDSRGKIIHNFEDGDEIDPRTLKREKVIRESNESHGYYRKTDPNVRKYEVEGIKYHDD
jgi:hypothetical protein